MGPKTIDGKTYIIGSDNIIRRVEGRNSSEVTDAAEKSRVYQGFNLNSDGTARAATAPTTQGNGTTGAGSTTISGVRLELKTKLSGVSLSYPPNLHDTKNKQTYLRFKSYDFSTLQASNQVYNPGDLGSFLSGAISNVAISTTSSAVANIPYSEDTIDLYVPPGINIGYGANWGESTLGAIGAQRSASTVNGNFLDQFASSFSSLLGAGNQALLQGGLNAISDALKNVPGFTAGPNDIFGLLTGLVFNENRFSTFTDIPTRTFDYSFILVARSKNEMKDINRIINVFKIAMHPAGLTLGYTGTAGGENSTADKKPFGAVARPPILKYPKLWTIEYFIGDKENRFLPKTKFCAITRINVNYTPNSVFTTLIDGEIPAIQLDLSFKELTPLFADEILDPSIAGSLFGGENDGLSRANNAGTDYTPIGRGTF